MLSIVKYLFEAKTHGYSGYTKENVHTGFGKLAGNVVLGVPGAVAGHYIAKGASSDKSKKEQIDERKISDRFGSSANESLNAKRMAKGAGIGVAAGLTAAAIVAAIKHGEVNAGEVDADDVGKIATLGTAGGATLGMGGGQMVGAHKAMKKLGYGKFGRRVGTVLPGAVSLAKPKQIKDEEKKIVEKHSK